MRRGQAALRTTVALLVIGALATSLSGCAGTTASTTTLSTTASLPTSTSGSTSTSSSSSTSTRKPALTTTTLNVSEIEARTGRQVITAANAGQVALLRNLRHTSGRVISDLQFSPDGTLLGSTEWAKPEEQTDEADRAVQLWDVDEGQLLQSWVADRPQNIGFLEAGHQLAYTEYLTIDYDTGEMTPGELWLVDLVSESATEPSCLEGDFGSVLSLGTGSEGQWLIGSRQGDLLLWNMETQQSQVLLSDSDRPEGMSFSDVALTPDGRQVYLAWVAFDPGTSDPESSSLLWVDLDTGTQHMLKDPSYKGYEKSQCNSIAVSPDGTLLATAGDFGLVVWDLQTGRVKWEAGSSASTSGGTVQGTAPVAFSVNGALLVSDYHASPSSGRGAAIWDVSTGELKAELVAHEESGTVRLLAVSPDGTLIACAVGGLVTIWGIGGAEVDLPVFAITGDEDDCGFSSSISPAWKATSERPARYEIEFRSSSREVDRADYEEGHVFIVVQRTVKVTVTDLDSGQIVGAESFAGTSSYPGGFPLTWNFQGLETYTYETSPSAIDFSDWLIGLVKGLGYGI